ncbi:MAG: hypothetical protein R3F62_19215 [Planctomycetota bacterium]
MLLIDEVDKADIEFPNDLLHEPDRMRFRVNETGDEVEATQRPVVVITSNNEKELPDAFLRRCVFHFIEFLEAALMKRDRRTTRTRPGAGSASAGRVLRPAPDAFGAAQAPGAHQRADRLDRRAQGVRDRQGRARQGPALPQHADQEGAGPAVVNRISKGPASRWRR